MANTHTTLTSLFTDIADSIRSMKGSTGTIKADNFPAEILSIPTGGLPPIGTLPAKTTLENTSWDDISIVSRMGKASEYWSIGDTKTITLGDITYKFVIIGFDHDDVTDAETYGRSKAGITFQLGVPNDSTEISCFSQSNNAELCISNIAFRRSTLDTSPGYGWNNSTARAMLYGIVDYSMPSEVKKVLIPVNKISAKSYQNELATTSDKYFLLSEKEYSGINSHSLDGEGSRYAYYTSFTNKQLKRYYKSTSGSGSIEEAYTYLTRSLSDSSNNECVIWSRGPVDFTDQEVTATSRFTFAFCV